MSFKFNLDGSAPSAPETERGEAPTEEVHPPPNAAPPSIYNVLIVHPELKFLQTPPPQTAHPHTDIIPYEYEGGYKVWECSLDLVTYLSESVSFSGKSVLELGAGHALPAIQALRMGAKEVAVHDYNREVVENVSIGNVAMNGGTARYFCGGWGGIQGGYDVVLTAETVYTEELCGKLARCLMRILGGGVAYVAGKSCYFGCGGGVRVFEKAVRELGGGVEVVKVVRDGVSNVREIVKVTGM